MDYDIQIEETADFAAAQAEQELRQWVKTEARRLYNTYNAIMANAWPGDETKAFDELQDHCREYNIDPETLDNNEPEESGFLIPSKPVVEVINDEIPF